MPSQKSAPVTVPATVAHRQFGDLVRRAFSGKEHFIVEKDGLPVVAILSMAEYEDLMQERERREKRLKHFRQLARDIGQEYERRGLTEDEVLAELEKTRDEVYQEHYGSDQEQ
jgi:prevent-host-death family protein